MMLHALYQWMLSWSDSPYAAPALFLLALAESSVFPIPPDVLLMALTLGHPSWGLYYATLTTVGSVLGGMLGYLIGWWGGRPLLLRLIGQDRMSNVHDMFERYEGRAILIGGLTPLPYKLFAIGAGAFYVNFQVFVAASLLSRGARFFLVAGTLQLLGPWVKEFLERYFNLFTVILVTGLVLGYWMIKRQKAVEHSASPTHE